MPVMLSTCAIAVFSTEPWNLWILSNQSTSSIMLSCGHTAKELKERVDVCGTGVEGGQYGLLADTPDCQPSGQGLIPGRSRAKDLFHSFESKPV